MSVPNNSQSADRTDFRVDYFGMTTHDGVGNCHTTFWPGRDFETYADYVLVMVNVLVAFVNIFSNALVILIIVKTRQYKNQSLKLTLLLSAADLCTALISQPLQVYFLYDKHSNSCTLKLGLQVFFYFFPYFSVFTIAFIVYDRFVRITYLNKYEQYMTKKRFGFGVAIVFCATTMQVALITVATLKKEHRYASIGVLPLNIITLVLEIFVYSKTIYKLHKYKKERKKRLKASDTSMVKLAALYLLMIIIFFTPFMIINTVYGYTSFFNQSFVTVQYTWLISQVAYVCNSFVNAVMFLYVNRKARGEMKLFLRKFTKTNLARAHTFEMSSCKSSSSSVVWRRSTDSTDGIFENTKKL